MLCLENSLSQGEWHTLGQRSPSPLALDDRLRRTEHRLPSRGWPSPRRACRRVHQESPSCRGRAKPQSGSNHTASSTFPFQRAPAAGTLTGVSAVSSRAPAEKSCRKWWLCSPCLTAYLHTLQVHLPLKTEAGVLQGVNILPGRRRKVQAQVRHSRPGGRQRRCRGVREVGSKAAPGRGGGRTGVHRLDAHLHAPDSLQAVPATEREQITDWPKPVSSHMEENRPKLHPKIH